MIAKKVVSCLVMQPRSGSAGACTPRIRAELQFNYNLQSRKVLQPQRASPMPLALSGMALALHILCVSTDAG
jgi:hypothetical protein